MILYFSATGNSRWVALQLAERLSMSAEKITTWKRGFSPFVGRESLFLVFPVHSWGPAIPMADFIEQMSVDGYAGQSIYAVCVCGDDCGRTDRIVARILDRKGLHLTAVFSVTMPNNYILLPGFDVDIPEIAEQKLHAAPARLGAIVKAVDEENSQELYRAGSFAWLKSWVYPLFKRYARSSNRFYATSACTACGKCKVLCPTGVIVFDANGRPQWHKKGCVQCSACIHGCPQRAIEYGTITQHKGRYRHADLH